MISEIILREGHSLIREFDMHVTPWVPSQAQKKKNRDANLDATQELNLFLFLHISSCQTFWPLDILENYSIT